VTIVTHAPALFFLFLFSLARRRGRGFYFLATYVRSLKKGTQNND